MAEENSGQDFGDAEDPRLTALDERLRQARDTEAARSGVTTKDAGPGYAQGNRVISALIGSLVGSALIVFGVTFLSFLTAIVTSLFVSADQERAQIEEQELRAVSEDETRALLRQLDGRLARIEAKLDR